MANNQPYRINSISEFHRLRVLPKPEHPLISVINVGSITIDKGPQSWVQDFYSIALKRCLSTKFRYGQQQYDFDEGVMFFMAPNQVYRIDTSQEPAAKPSGFLMLIHPDFLWNTSLAKTIRQYEYFDYAVNEALFLSEKEEGIIAEIMQNIQQEYHANIDTFSQNIIIAQIELLLRYSERFYQRQFITRKISNHKILDRLEVMLEDYFSSDDLIERGLPTVLHVAGQLHVSPSYLSSLLKTLTGQTTQQHIHNKLITKAKEKLSTTNLSITEIAYGLGFEHSQSFSKLFKDKTDFSPSEFRQSFN